MSTDPPAVTMAPALTSWYKKTIARHLDLVGDYAGKERFFIEGDSLLLECFSNPQLDFDPGFQLLHAVYLVEKFLHDLIKRGCIFDVVFFSDHEEHCIPRNTSNHFRYLLARNVIICHLRKNATNINTLRFKSLEDGIFQEYLENSAVYFALCSDGSNYIQKSLTTLALRNYTNSQSQSIANGEHRTRLRAIIYQFEQYGLDVALLNGLNFRDSKIFAFVLERASSSNSADGDVISNEISDLARPTAFEFSHLNAQGRLKASLTEHSQIFERVNAILLSHNFRRPSSRLMTTTIACYILASNKSFIQRLIPACLVTAFLLESIPLADRRVATIAFEQSYEDHYSEFTNLFALACLQIQKLSVGALPYDTSGADLVDGRMLRATLGDYHGTLSTLPESTQKVLLPELLGLFSDVQCNNDHQPDFQPLPIPAPATEGIELAHVASILPFSHPAFDQHLREIDVRSLSTVKPQRGTADVVEMIQADKKRRPKVPLKTRILSPLEQKRAMKKKQRFMAEMMLYSASLANANGKPISPELISVEDEIKGSSKSLTIRSGNSSKVAKREPKKQTTIREKIAIETERSRHKKELSAMAAWIKVREGFDQESNEHRKYSLVMSYSRDISERRDIHAVVAEVGFYRVSVLCRIWANFCRQRQREHGFHIAALIYDGLLLLSNSVHLTNDISGAMTDIAQLCGMYLKKVSRKTLVDGPSLSFKSPTITDVPLQIGCDPLEFKLSQMGPYLERAMDAEEDSRVSGFVPDFWQRKVLDALDANESLLVVAPTSSGKTFISFYAMEKVLRAGNEGVIVYVAPTKALVNQIAAEVQARFTKKYPYPGTSVYAISIRDYKVNIPKQCQVLVTVPQILQFMLMSPNNQSWVPRIRTIIFDEVHSIGNAEEGVVWEQLLLSAPCQVVALSATVGNSEAFANWLSASQSAMGRTSNMIEHEHRFSDLRKYIFDTPDTFAFQGLPEKQPIAPLGLETVDGLAFLHPVCCLGHPQRGMPPDLALESRDCLLLWKAMTKAETNSYPVPEGLSPSRYFPDTSVAKSDVVRWATDLKAVLSSWMQDSMSPFKAVVADLSKELPQPKPHSRRKIIADDVKEAKDTSQVADRELMESTLPLLCKLQEGGALPSIFFNFNRSACEDIVAHVQEELFEAELKFKETDSAWKIKIQQYEEWKKITEAQKTAKQALTGKLQKKRTGQDRDDQRQEAPGNEEGANQSDNSRFQYFDPSSPLQKFSFADPKKLDTLELTKLVDTFEWNGVDKKLIDAFKRGIAVHHSGMPRRYRQAVEIWFRRGFLTVIVATGTLSLGINMPCKTVVFSGDSVYLTALNYRQSAGRAGRRGFDLLGNVVFQNVSVRKACRLLSSRLPDISGHFPLTTQFVLRLLVLLNGTNNAPYAMKMANSLLSQPRLYLGGKTFKHQVLHHVRFSIEYLRSQGLIDAEGKPVNFAGSICHLASPHEEDSAFILHALLRAGYFEELAEELDAKEDATLLTLMKLMANLFGRLSMRPMDAEQVAAIAKESSSIVALPPIPQKAMKVLRDHDKLTLQTYVNYVDTFVDQHCREPDFTLPLTKIHVTPVERVAALKPPISLAATRLRSPFVALSGCDDNFTSITDLCQSVRDGVFLEEAVIPHLDVDEYLQVPLNAYLYDFYRHGNTTELIQANRIQRSDLWYVLNAFSQVLAIIIAALENILKGDVHGDIESVGLADEKALEMDIADNPGDESLDQTPHANGQEARTDSIDSGSRYQSENENGRAPGPESKLAEKAKKTKKKVVDSWEDSDSGGEDAEQSDGVAVAEQAKMDAEAARRLRKVVVMFQKLKLEYDIKFKKMWA